MNDFIRDLYNCGNAVGKSGKTHSLHSTIDATEGLFLHRLIAADPTIGKTLEIGCAYGLSSLHICHSTKDRRNAEHLIIDPFQDSQWDGVGVQNLMRSGISAFRLIEERSEFALPQLLTRGEGCLDFVFVDGWHTLDHTMIDCFYANRLLRVGGILAIDDLTMPGVRVVADYFSAYPCYRSVGHIGATSGEIRMVAFKKIARDERPWDWFPSSKIET